MATILQISDFVKNFRTNWTFKEVQAIKGISLEIEAGEAFGFLGPNGAGKTTTIKCILGLIKKTKGNILFDGKDLTLPTQRAKLGYLPEQPYFYDHLTVKETLDFFASLHGIKSTERNKRVNEILERLRIADRASSPIKSLSKGWQQRVGLAQAIINKPKLLLLDEPFSGLDPLGRKEFRDLIVEMNRNGTTIFMSSHILSDVEDICTRVSIMANGVIEDTFSLKDMGNTFGVNYLVTIKELPQNSLFIERARSGSHDVDVTKSTTCNYLTFHYEDYESAAKALADATSSGVRIEQFESRPPTLEEVFVNITTGNGKTSVE